MRCAAFAVLAVLVVPAEGLLLSPARTAPRGAMFAPRRAAVSGRGALVIAQEGDSGGDGGEREKSRGRTAVISRPKPKPKQDRREEVDKEKSWRVLLHNDDVRAPHVLSTPLMLARPRGTRCEQAR